MYLRVDTRSVPPIVEVGDQENFTEFKVVVVTSNHVWVSPAALTDLAGRGKDHAWQDELAKMISYAESKGWLDDEGHIRAHVELTTEPGQPNEHQA